MKPFETNHPCPTPGCQNRGWAWPDEPDDAFECPKCEADYAAAEYAWDNEAELRMERMASDRADLLHNDDIPF